MKRNLVMLMGLLAVAAGCQKTESKTEIILEISTNISVPAGMDTLSLKIGPQTNPQALSKTYPLGTGAGQIMLPRRMTLVPTDTSTVLNVLVEGLLGGKMVVSRSVITGFAKGESKLLSIELLQKCVGRVCENGQTCKPSEYCADPRLDPKSLPSFDPSKQPQSPALDPDAGASVDALSGKEVSSFDGQPGVDKPGDGRIDGPDGSIVGDGPQGLKLDTGTVIDAPTSGSDVPPGSKTKGVACGLSGECQSGLCVDGVCCEGTCTGLCMACNVPGNLGTCSPVPLNDPSNGDCPDDGVATCGRNGRCDGRGGCMMYPSGVACSAETCPAGTTSHTRAGLCDGQGHCGKGQVQDCTPFKCDATTKACSLTCTSTSDCVAPNQCNNGSCGKKGNGLPCSVSEDCQSNVCAQGVCCGGPCTDLCKSCAVDGSLGTCTAVPAGKPDVQSRCQDNGVATCGTNGLCDGAGACQKYGDSLTCGAQCNPQAASFAISTCSAGTCTPGAAQSCAPYSCDNTGCKKSCTVLSDCAPGFVCGAGGLCVRSPEDCMNGVDDDGDGLVDCADPDCQPGFMCVPVVPGGFKGPVELFDGPEASMPSCGGNYPVDHFKGWGSLQCPGNCNCRCGAVSGVTCTLPSLGIGKAPTLPYGFCPVAKSILKDTENTCQQAPLTVPATEYRTANIVAGTPSGGTCPTAVDPPLPTAWNAARVCGIDAGGGGGCDKESICWPRPQTAFAPQACVIGSGNVACPASGYIKKRDYFDAPEIYDNRVCSATGCGCDGATGASCNASVDLFGTPPLKGGVACKDAFLMTVTATACQTLKTTSSAFDLYRVNVPNPAFSGGTCAPTGAGTLTGGCTPKGNQATVCCVP